MRYQNENAKWHFVQRSAHRLCDVTHSKSPFVG